MASGISRTSSICSRPLSNAARHALVGADGDGQGSRGRHDRARPSLRTDDQIIGYYHQTIEAIGDDIPFVIQD
jgi:hypothetical protein